MSPAAFAVTLGAEQLAPLEGQTLSPVAHLV
jgi:hypothetical protein